jgi:hypothetical protein
VKKLAISLCVAAASSFPLASAVHAQASMDVLCAQRPNAIPCVRDATGKVVGIPSSFFTVARQIRGKWYSLNVQEMDIPAQGTYFYSGPNCTGSIFVSTKYYMPEAALYDGASIFASADNTDLGFDWQSYSFLAKKSRGGQCYNYGSNCSGDGQPCHANAGGPISAVIENVHFAPPLKMQ